MSPALEKERIDHQILNLIFSGTEPDRNTLAEYQIHLAAFFCISVPECLGRGVGKHPEKLWVKIPNYFCLSAYLNDVRSARGYATGRWVLPNLTTFRSRKPCLLGSCCFSVRLGTGKDFPATFKLKDSGSNTVVSFPLTCLAMRLISCFIFILPIRSIDFYYPEFQAAHVLIFRDKSEICFLESANEAIFVHKLVRKAHRSVNTIKTGVFWTKHPLRPHWAPIHITNVYSIG